MRALREKTVSIAITPSPIASAGHSRDAGYQLGRRHAATA